MPNVEPNLKPDFLVEATKFSELLYSASRRSGEAYTEERIQRWMEAGQELIARALNMNMDGCDSSFVAGTLSKLVLMEIMADKDDPVRPDAIAFIEKFTTLHGTKFFKSDTDSNSASSSDNDSVDERVETVEQADIADQPEAPDTKCRIM